LIFSIILKGEGDDARKKAMPFLNTLDYLAKLEAA